MAHLRSVPWLGGRATLALLTLSLGWACSDDKSGAEITAATGLALTADLTSRADVATVRFALTPVDCDTGEAIGDPLVSERPLSDFTIPGDVAALEDAPLDGDSAHAFADAFMDLPAGCYDVLALPLSADGEPSRACASAEAHRVTVVEGQTTEIMLINQCWGRDPGALDAIATLNHEPELSLEFESSKFVHCEQPQVVCATAADPDRDPVEFLWSIDAAPAALAGPVVKSHDVDAASGAVTECVEFVPSTAGRYDVAVTAYDLFWHEGELVRAEDWLALAGYPSESHSSTSFFFYAGDCEEPDGPASRYDIALAPLGSVSEPVRAAFDAAVARWQSHVIGDVPDIALSGVPAGLCGIAHPAIDGVVDDIAIYASIETIDGRGGILGSAGPCLIRSDSGLPIVGVMQFDADDLEFLESEGLLGATILHELAHVLGVGSLWGYLGRLENPSLGLPPGSVDTRFVGALAESAFDAVGGAAYKGLKVPAENQLGAAGTRDAHWRESVLGNELMTGFIDLLSNPLSSVTVASLADLGYVVELAGSDDYTLPAAALSSALGTPNVLLENDVWQGPLYAVDTDGALHELGR